MTTNDLIKIKESEAGKYLQERYSKVFNEYKKYKDLHDDILEVLMYSSVILKQPSHTDKDTIIQILNLIEGLD